MKCDLHVHTIHSGMCTVPVLSRVCLESYNAPEELYQQLKRRGMDLVTVTDHDSIDAVESLRRHPDFFLSEEVTCTMPSGTEMHAGVYGIAEEDHQELQRRRNDIESFLAYTKERRLFVTVNHLYSSLTGRRDEDDFLIFAKDFPGVEILNGQMLRASNRMAAEFASRFGHAVIGGSDSHTLAGVAKTFTEVPEAATVEEYLAGLRCGYGVPQGESGDYLKLTSDVFSIGAELVRSSPRFALCGALFAFVPLVTLAHYFREVAFAWYWGQKNKPADPVGVTPEVEAGAGV